MTVRRNNKPRRRTQRKRTIKPKTKIDKKLSRRITKLEKQREMKYYDTTNTIKPTAAGTALSLVQLIHRGDQYNEREGDNIYTSGLKYSYILTKPASSPDPQPPYQIRCIILWDKANNGGGSFNIFTGVAPTAILESTSIFDNRDGMTNINSPYSMMTKDRYKILYDRIHVMNSTGGISAASSIVQKGFIKLSGAKVQYTDAEDAGGIDELVSRNLIFLYFCAGTEEVAINFTARLFYHDD